METTEIALRPSAEIQAAHDRLVAILLGDVPNPFAESDMERIVAATNVLCWVLRHEYNPRFEKVIADIDSFLARLGLELVDSGTLCARDER